MIPGPLKSLFRDSSRAAALHLSHLKYSGAGLHLATSYPFCAEEDVKARGQAELCRRGRASQSPGPVLRALASAPAGPRGPCWP